MWFSGWDDGKEHGNYYIVYWGYIGMMEKKNGNYCIVYCGYIGIMVKWKLLHGMLGDMFSFLKYEAWIKANYGLERFGVLAHEITALVIFRGARQLCLLQSSNPELPMLRPKP